MGISSSRKHGQLSTNLALLPSGFLGGLLILVISDLVDFVTEVFARLLILSGSQHETQTSRVVKQTFAAFFFGAALALGLDSAFAFG